MVNLKGLMMMLELHQQGLSASAPPGFTASSDNKNLSVNKAALRCDENAMDARRKPQPRVAPCARLATTQTRIVVTTLRAGAVIFTDRF